MFKMKCLPSFLSDPCRQRSGWTRCWSGWTPSSPAWTRRRWRSHAWRRRWRRCARRTSACRRSRRPRSSSSSASQSGSSRPSTRTDHERTVLRLTLSMWFTSGFQKGTNIWLKHESRSMGFVEEGMKVMAKTYGANIVCLLSRVPLLRLWFKMCLIHYCSIWQGTLSLRNPEERRPCWCLMDLRTDSSFWPMWYWIYRLKPWTCDGTGI